MWGAQHQGTCQTRLASRMPKIIKRVFQTLRIKSTPFVTRSAFRVANTLAQDSIVRPYSTRSFCVLRLGVTFRDDFLVLVRYIVIFLLLYIDVAQVTTPP